jgi:hypothetical protein
VIGVQLLGFSGAEREHGQIEIRVVDVPDEVTLLGVDGAVPPVRTVVSM